MTACACPTESRPAMTTVPRPPDSWAGMSPAAWAARNWAATTSVTASEFLARGWIASAGSVSESAR
jgi:hypothetical protein